MKAYTRANPSPRHQRLLALYREMHRDGEVHLGIPPQGATAPVERVLTNREAWASSSPVVA